MRTRKNILKISLGLTATTSLFGACYSLCANKSISLKSISYNEITKKSIDAKKLGADKDYIDIEYTDPSHCKITDRHWFAASKSFNFNGGKFIQDGIEYTITELCLSAFFCLIVDWNFKECNLTIPGTIKKIGDQAFHMNASTIGSKEIISIAFEEGVEEIGEAAFYKCDDLTNKTIKLPNSIKHIGNIAFAMKSLDVLDLSTLDHVIKLDANPLEYQKGAFYGDGIKKIIVKNQMMKDKYCNDEYWSGAKDLFVY